MCQNIDKDFEMTEEAFEQIFKMIDVSGDHVVSMDEMIAFLENFTHGDEKQVVADA
jgi:Ca2+-binding EF-hand superfamily protein